MASLLYLDTYEKQLLKSQESSMIQQARMLSAALTGSGNVERDAQRLLPILRAGLIQGIRVVTRRGASCRLIRIACRGSCFESRFAQL